jgi:hypothetical protein
LSQNYQKGISKGAVILRGASPIGGGFEDRIKEPVISIHEAKSDRLKQVNSSGGDKFFI